jgi:hypothetical protein
MFYRASVTINKTMPDEMPPTPSAPPPSAAPGKARDFRIDEEFGTAKKNLPPTKIVLIGIAAIALVTGIVELIQKPTSTATGFLTDPVAVEIPNQNAVMVAINVSIHNGGKKPYWIHDVSADLDTEGQKYNAQAASVADFDRYFQAFPDLKQHALEPLKPETKILPGGDTAGTVIVSFPVLPNAFWNRKSLQLKIQPYDQPVPLVLSK